MGNKETNGGISLNMILFLIFLVLKLTGHIDWSWWWVTSPLWIGLILFIVIVLIIQLIFNK